VRVPSVSDTPPNRTPGTSRGPPGNRRSYLQVSGPGIASTYVWTEEEADRYRGPNWLTRIHCYPNRILDLYSDNGFLVIKWTRWRSPERPHDDHPQVDRYTMINLDQIVYLNAINYQDETYGIRVGLANTN
jgi:hypothetical protein